MTKNKLFRLLILIAFFSLVFLSCKPNHEKITKKLFEKYNEVECKNIVQTIGKEIVQNKYYKWDGNKCVLTVEGDLDNAVEQLINFHKDNHCFTDKKGSFNQNEWNHWMYYYINQDEAVNLDSLTTDCFICFEKLQDGNLETFENNAYNSKEDLLYKSFYGKKIKELEEEYTVLYKEKLKIDWMEKCTIQMTDYIYNSKKTLKQLLTGMPDTVTVEKETDGNNLILRAYIAMEGEKVISLESKLQCMKATSSCYCIESNFTINGQTVSAKVWRNVYSDPEGAGECLSYLCKGIELLKVFERK